MPSAESAGLSAEAANSKRAATWPMTSTAVTASTRAKTARAIAEGRMARSIVAACAASSATNTCPPVPG